MKTQPIEPGRIAHGVEPGLALALARRVWLPGNGLPQRWVGRDDFVILVTGFGAGHSFIALWDAWRRDLQRCTRLHIVAVEQHPLTRADLARAHAGSSLPDRVAALLQAWPPLTPNLHLLDFEHGRVSLTLALGDPATLLPALRLQADAIVLDDLLPPPWAWTARSLKAVARLAAPDATAASASAAPGLQTALATAGFEVEPSLPTAFTRAAAPTTLARWAPRFPTRRLPIAAVRTPDAVVVGAGLAGAMMAQALARQGLTVTVLEREAGPAQAASGNPAGLFHGTVNGADGTYARLFRSAALFAASEVRHALAGGRVRGQVAGLLRLAHPAQGLAGLQQVLQPLGLPPDYVQALDAAAASTRAGVRVGEACWYYPAGGWVAPPDWVLEALRTPGIRVQAEAVVQRLVRQGPAWQLLDSSGQQLARSPLLVLALAAGTQRLLQPLGHAPWPLRQTRGQVTHWALHGPPALHLPVAGDGYALPLQDGLLCGATRQHDDADGEVRHADHLENLQRLQRLTGLLPPADSRLWQGRVGWRLQADDRLPIAGAMPLADLSAQGRQDQARLLPREPGLFVLTALGARGLTLAPLLARLVAAQATGTPWPLEQDLADAVDPARWLVRAARARQAAPPREAQAG